MTEREQYLNSPESHTHTLDEVYRRIGNVQAEVHELSLMKQDKVKPAIVISFLFFLFTQTVTAVWWASKLTNGVENIGREVANLSVDRFYGKDGEQLQRLWEIENTAVKREIADLKSQLRDTRITMNETTATLRGMQSIQSECAKKLNLGPKGPSNN